MEETYQVNECGVCDISEICWTDGVEECPKCGRGMTIIGYIDEVPLKDFIWHTVKKED